MADTGLVGRFTALDVASPPAAASAPAVTVVFHGACAGHRFVRRNVVDTTVERPERLDAVRDGVESLQAAIAAHGAPRQLVVRESQRHVALTDAPVLAAHDRAFIDDLTRWCDTAAAALARGELELPASLPTNDLYLCAHSHTAMTGALGAAFDAVDAACAGGRASFAAVRPPGHHAKCGDPSGFCYVNNVVCAAMYAAGVHRISRVAIVDIDLHHGDGTQQIVRKLSLERPGQPALFYGSLHDVLSFPTEIYDEHKVNEASLCVAAHGLHLWNVHLEPYKSVGEYEQLYRDKYSALVRQADRFLAAGKPAECLIIVSAGFDAHEKETPGIQRHKRHVPDRFYHRFTEDLQAVATARCGGRLVSVLEGGYSHDALAMGVSGHIGALLGLSEAHSKYTVRPGRSGVTTRNAAKAAPTTPSVKAEPGMPAALTPPPRATASAAASPRTPAEPPQAVSPAAATPPPKPSPGAL